jgi:hypothetical protein
VNADSLWGIPKLNDSLCRVSGLVLKSDSSTRSNSECCWSKELS